MRIETIQNGEVQVRWHDARYGVSQIEDPTALDTLINYFDEQAESLDGPFSSETREVALEFRALHPDKAPFPCLVTITRLPKNELQKAAWHYATETKSARIEEQDGVLGMLFLDENIFIPFTELKYDSVSGFSRLPQ